MKNVEKKLYLVVAKKCYFSNTPKIIFFDFHSRKLSQSFGLELTGTTLNNRQSMLSVINQILISHEPYKRSHDAMLKAFVCAGLK